MLNDMNIFHLLHACYMPRQSDLKSKEVGVGGACSTHGIHEKWL
jgi:hypothetical protein